jgi:hypothetical protein
VRGVEGAPRGMPYVGGGAGPRAFDWSG